MSEDKAKIGYAVIAHQDGQNPHLLLGDPQDSVWVTPDQIPSIKEEDLSGPDGQALSHLALIGFRNAVGPARQTTYSKKLSELFAGKTGAKYELSVGRVTFTAELITLDFTSTTDDGNTLDNSYMVSRNPAPEIA